MTSKMKNFPKVSEVLKDTLALSIINISKVRNYVSLKVKF